MIARIRKSIEEREDKGFTLVELLVVIIIIGILAAIAIPLYLNQQNKAKDSAAQADLSTIRTAVVSAMTENPNADNIAWAQSGEVVTITTTGGDNAGDNGTVGISPGNTLTDGNVDLDSPESLSIAIESGAGNTFTIDANGNVTKASA